tara:strand:+ start:951 stop:1229 length:279 start_codon:yes stop_codon:yes gene_type:complete
MPNKKKDPKVKNPFKGIKKKPAPMGKGISLKAGFKKLMGGGTARKPMMAKSGKSIKIKGLTPAQKGSLKAGKGKKGVSLKAGFKKLRRGGKA